jgi:hypothetical protein
MAIFDGLKGAADALRQADKIPQFQAVLDAQARLAELQEYNHQQAIEIRQLREELERLRADQASAEGYEIWRDLLWIKNDDDPYCVHCFDKNKRLFHVSRVRGKSLTLSDTVCPECKSRTELAPKKSHWQLELEQMADRAYPSRDEDAN